MITVTIKLKSYLPTSVTSVSSMDGQGTESKGKIATVDGVAAAVSATERLATMVDTLTKRMEKLEASHGSTEGRPAHGREGQRNYTHKTGSDLLPLQPATTYCALLLSSASWETINLWQK